MDRTGKLQSIFLKLKPARAGLTLAVLCVVVVLGLFVCRPLALAALVGCFGVTVYLNLQCLLVERERERIINGFSPPPEVPLPNTILPSVVSGLCLILVIPLGFHMLDLVSNGAGFTMERPIGFGDWFVFFVQQVVASILDFLEIYSINLTSIGPEHWLARTLVFLVRLSVSLLLIQVIVRAYSHHVMVRDTISSLAVNPEFAIGKLQRIGKVSVSKVVRRLQGDGSEDERVGCARTLGGIRCEEATEGLRSILENYRSLSPGLVYSASASLAEQRSNREVCELWEKQERTLRRLPPPAVERGQLHQLVERHVSVEWAELDEENSSATIFRKVDGMRMVFVPGGFTAINPMVEGQEERGPWTGIQPERVPYVSGFFMDVFPVTVRQYLVFLREKDPEGQANRLEHPWLFSPHRLSVRFDFEQGWNAVDSDFLDCPMVYVSWFGAVEYCRWAGARLPSVAQWTRASRGDYPDRRRFPWGDAEPDPSLANFAYEDAPACPTPVGRCPDGRSPFGIHDLSGNVEEWASDAWTADYCWRISALDPEVVVDGASLRPLMGGGWDGDAKELAIDNPFQVAPMGWLSDRGFRCVLPVSWLIVDPDNPSANIEPSSS